MGLLFLAVIALASAINGPPGTLVSSFFCGDFSSFPFCFTCTGVVVTARVARAMLDGASVLVRFFSQVEKNKKVTSLPGFNGPLPEMHSGYVTVDEQAGRAIFYVLVSATGVDPTTAPLVFW